MGAIKHIFVLMLENRSFDHLFGFADLQGPNAEDPATEIHADDVITFRQGPDWDRIGNPDPKSGQRVWPTLGAPFKIYPPFQSPAHEFNDVVEQLCGPGATYSRPPYPPITNTGFVSNYSRHGAPDPKWSMQCFKPEDIPVLTTLAREFAVCDRWFSSLPGPTWPNRFFVHAASSDGMDDSPSSVGALFHEVGPGYRFEHATIFDRLGTDWLIVQGDPFPQVFSIKGMFEQRLDGRFVSREAFVDKVQQADFSAKYVFVEPNYGRIYGDYVGGTSQHPIDDITQGEWLIKETYEAIRKSPHWEESLLVIVYDEHGGFFDHAVPPSATPPADQVQIASNNQHHFDFTCLGPRVPAVLVSPLIPKGTIDHRTYDHASVPATLRKLFNLGGPLTNRDAAANTFDGVCSLAAARDTPPTLPNPPDSGFRPDAQDALGNPDADIDPNVRAFLYVAFLQQYGITPDQAQRSPIAARFLRISTRVQAMEFFEEARHTAKRDLR